MRLLADENVPRSAVEAMRRAGQDVRWIREDAPGEFDAAILSRAVEEARILLTFDKDFGELARHHGLSADSGVILVRLPMPPGDEAGLHLSRIIGARRDWAGHFAVLEPGRVRMRRLTRAGTRA